MMHLVDVIKIGESVTLDCYGSGLFILRDNSTPKSDGLTFLAGYNDIVQALDAFWTLEETYQTAKRPKSAVLFDPAWDDEDLFDQPEPEPEVQVFHPEYGWMTETDLALTQSCGDLDAYEERRRERIALANEY